MNSKKNNISKLVLVSTLIFTLGLFQSAVVVDLNASDIEAKTASHPPQKQDAKLSANPVAVKETVSKKTYSDNELISILGISVNGGSSLATDGNLEFSGSYDTTKPGTYSIKVMFSNRDYNSAIIYLNLVVEQVPAQISATKTSKTVNYGETISDLKKEFGINAWEFDQAGGDLNKNVTMTGSVNYNVPGTYKLTFFTHDDDTPQTTAQVMVEVVVVDGAPVVSSAPSNIEMVEEAEVLTNESILSKSGVGFKYSNGTPVAANDIMLSVGPSGSLAFDYGKTPGTYHAVATVYNASATKSATAEFDIIVSDVLPTITSGNKNYFVPVGTPLPTQETLESWFQISGYEFAGVSNDYTISYYFVNKQGYKNEHPTNNPIKFVITDNDGQTAEVEVNLHIKKKGYVPGTDPVPPVVHSNKVVESPEGNILNAEALIEKFIVDVDDDEDGNYTIEVSHNINWFLAQDYPVTFTVKDGNGLTTTVVRTLRLTDLKPSISYKYNPIYYVQGNQLPEFKKAFGISATEISSGDLTSKVQTFVPGNIQMPGLHYITFKVKDNEGNEVIRKLKCYTLEPVNSVPIITGTDFIEVPENDGEALTKADLISMFGISAMDYEDGMLAMDAITVTGAPVDLHHPDAYTIKFVAKDSKGAEVVFKAILKVTDVKPVMKIKTKYSYRPLNEPIADLLAEFGVKATEFKKGDLNDSIVITYEKYGEYDMMPVDEIDYSQDGFYRITFTAMDEEGNTVSKKAFLEIGGYYNEVEFDAMSEITIPEELNLSVQDLIAKFDPMAYEFSGEDVIDLFDKIGLTGSYNLHKPSKAGEPYELILTLNYNDEIYEIPVYLNITDILPTIEADNELVTIKDTDQLTIEKLLELFGITATEINENDLYDQVKVDFSSIISKGGKLIPGAYPVVFTAVDEEGNEVSTTTTVEVQDTSIDEEEPDSEEPDSSDTDSEVTEEEDTDSEVAEEEDTDDTDSEVVAEETDDETDTETTTTKTMTLATTGNEVIAMLAIMGLVLFALLIAKLNVTNNKQ